MENKDYSFDDVIKKLREIEENEKNVAVAIGLVIDHIHYTYSDKYAKGQKLGVDTKKMLYHPNNGRIINQYQIAKYLQRYMTEGSEKSGLITDLFKIIHYSIFEIVRRINLINKK